ncbi:c-type cytochrome biogenesis protein CcmI [Aliiroseovarius sp. PTFE2010]|uniref:c-type cytochrome biogenesis protein CcmI n=1 Tax=Aliiroseovarius sp. PTFE2010 TaxID=3417190 RepID=UPI003CE9DEC7
MNDNDTVIFWMIAGTIGAIVAAGLMRAVLRAGRVAQTRATADLGIYRVQLAEVDRDEARGTIAPAEADAARLEIKRRILEADRSQQSGGQVHVLGSSARLALGGALAASVLVGAVWGYQRLGAPALPDQPLAARLAAADQLLANRPSQAAAEAEMPDQSVPDADPRHLELMAQLRAKLADRPDDLQGFRLLARNEAMLGNFRAAARAQGRVLSLQGDASSAQDYADYADLLAMAAGGYISPEAERSLEAALKREPNHPTALYYTGLMFAQNKRPDMAFRLWRPLVEQGDPSLPSVQAARRNIGVAAELAGVQYDLPPQTTLPGPSDQDMDNAANMSAEDRQEMIQGMVARLMDRLANDGGSAQEWARLLNALGVLGNLERARTIWGEAQTRFDDRPEELALIRDAAIAIGIAE